MILCTIFRAGSILSHEEMEKRYQNISKDIVIVFTVVDVHFQGLILTSKQKCCMKNEECCLECLLHSESIVSIQKRKYNLSQSKSERQTNNNDNDTGQDPYVLLGG